MVELGVPGPVVLVQRSEEGEERVALVPKIGRLLYHTGRISVCAPDGRKESAFSARQAENDRQGSCRRAGVIFRNGKLKEVALEKCGLLARKGRIGITLAPPLT